MTINIAIRERTASTGGNTDSIPGDGPIDTPDEARAAMAKLPAGDGSVIVVGTEIYDRARLQAMVAGTPVTPTPPQTPQTPPQTPPAAPESPSGHEIRLGGGYNAGSYNGGEFRLGYAYNALLGQADGHRFYLNPEVSLFARPGQGMDFTTPGSESGRSSFNAYGGGLGASFRWNPSWVESRFGLAAGLRLDLAGFSTPDSNMRDIPATPGECSPELWQLCETPAGPRRANIGNAGLYNPATGSARGTGGMALGVGIPITLDADIARWQGGSFGAYLNYTPTYNHLFPSDGNGVNFWSHFVGGGIQMRFGGSAAPVRREETPTPPPPPQGVTPLPAQEMGQVQLPGTYPAGTTASVNGRIVATAGADGILIIPPDALREGENTISVCRPGQSGGQCQGYTISINRPAAVTESSGGDIRAMANRMAMQGQTTPLQVAAIQVPAGQTFTYRVKYDDGTFSPDLTATAPAGSGTVPVPVMIPADKIGLGAATAAGTTRAVQIMILRRGTQAATPSGNSATVEYTVSSVPPTRIGTPAPAMGEASYVNRGNSLATALVNITGTTAIPGVSVRVNNHDYTVSLTPGANTIQLRNPGMRMNNNIAGVTPGTYPVVITIPGEAPISLSLVITRGGGGGGTRPPAARPPRL